MRWCIIFLQFFAVVRTPAIKESAIKQKFILLQFYFIFIAVVCAFFLPFFISIFCSARVANGHRN